MKIYVAQIPAEGVFLSEDIPSKKLELDTEIIKARDFIRVKAEISKITNAVTIDLEIQADMYCLCGRCIEEFELPLRKRLKINYSVDRTIQLIDLDPVIREEIIFEYPIAPLCRPDCLGLCVKCGHNLNRGQCACV